MRRKVLGVYSRTYLECERFNLCPRTWDREQARVRAAQLLNDRPGQVLVLLGRKVAEAFGVPDLPPFGSKQIIGGPLLVVLPHPSGLNRVWHEPGSVQRARTAIGAACPGFPVGEADVTATGGQE